MDLSRRDMIRNGLRYLVLAIITGFGLYIAKRNGSKTAIADCDYQCQNCPVTADCNAYSSEKIAK